jgi:peptidoglycan/LPS O-acetylase OafA/YrhL
VLRIIPAYWLALTVLAIYPGLVGLWGPDWWSYYGLLQIYDPITTLNGIPVAWTLCIEATFYVVLPFFAIATAYATRGRDAAVQVRVQLVVLALIALASVALRAVTDDVVLINSLPTHLYWFALGMTLAVLSVAWHDRADAPRLAQLVTDRPGTCWGLALVAYLAFGAILNSAPQHTFYSDGQLLAQYVLRGVVALFLMLPAVFGEGAGGWPRRVLGLCWLAWLGLISYGLYLWHYEIISVLAPKLDYAWAPLLVCALVVSTLCAAGSYYVVERPILRFKDFRGGRRARDKAERPPGSRRPSGARFVLVRLLRGWTNSA